MANGKPGDHPLTDILKHRLEVYGPVADGLIREIADLDGESLLERDFDLWALAPQWGGGNSADLAGFEQQLTVLRDRLREEARSRGWEV